VTIVSPTNGQVLVYNSSTSKWENSSAGFVPYTGAVTTVDLGAQSILAGSFVKAGGTSAQFLKADGSVDSTAYGTGSVTSVALTMPSAFSVAGSPITTAGTLAVTGAGTVGQYVRGDGSLADFPATTGGGSSVSYYLNSSVSQGTIGGVAYRELNRNPVFGAGTDISISSNGYIANFITDAGDPNKLLIPAGNWNLETYFSASSNGGSPTFYVELYKYDGSTFTLIASSATSPELIAFGTNLNPYFSTLAVPQTTLALTDRLALRYYVNTSGRTITLHTENNHLCQVITTFTTGLTALNGLTAQVQFFAVGTSGTDFNIASSTDTHTFNLPTASATNRGAVSSADWSIFNGKQAQLNGTGFVKASGTTISYDNSTYLTTSAAASTYLPLAGGTMTGALLMGTGVSAASNSQPTALSYGLLQGWSDFTLAADTDGSQTEFAVITSGYNVANAIAANGLAIGYNTLTWKNNTIWHAGNITPVTSVTGTSPIVSSGGTTPAISIPVATTSVNGYLSSTDWNTFNGKQNALTNPVTGTGASGQVAFWSSGSAITGESNLFWDATNDRLGIGTPTPATLLNLKSSTTTELRLESIGDTFRSFIGFRTDSQKWDLGINLNDLTDALSFNYLGSEKVRFNSAGTVIVSSSITANSFIKSAGTSAQFLKADGSVDSTTYVPVGRTITINGTTQDLSVDRTFNVGTVTSVTASSPLFSSGGATPNITIQQASGSQNGFLSSTDWTTFNNKTSNTGTVTSVGLSSATSGVTIGSTPVTTSGTITLAISTASSSQNGLLSSTDWTSFNNKQNALTSPVTGTGTIGQVAYFNGTTSITSESNLFWDSTNDRLGIGTNNPGHRLDVFGSGTVYTMIESSQQSLAALLVRNTAKTYGVGILNIGAFNATAWGVQDLTGGGGLSRLVITSGGNVLIGTETDVSGATLNVNGSMRTAATSQSAAANFRVGTITNGILAPNASFKMDINGTAVNVLITY
jgi:hypothetical protein